ncbi:MAG TPA: hypothetical protein VKD02_01060 [Methyloceanibacter sp.]|nr:hypothetical protein [Methyloceanibacter sp.]
MYRQSYPTYLAAAATWLLAGATGTPLLADATYCVTCKNPDQTYLCRVSAGGAKPNDALKLYCVIRTAKEGNHASCSAVSGANCNGIEKVYSYDGPMPEDFASDARIKKFKEKIQHEQKAFEKPKSDAPDTLVELTGRARERWRHARGSLTGSEASAGESLPPSEAQTLQDTGASTAASPAATEANAGERPSFARRSYRCVMSLFRNCNSGQ